MTSYTALDAVDLAAAQLRELLCAFAYNGDRSHVGVQAPTGLGKSSALREAAFMAVGRGQRWVVASFSHKLLDNIIGDEKGWGVMDINDPAKTEWCAGELLTVLHYRGKDTPNCERTRRDEGNACKGCEYRIGCPYLRQERALRRARLVLIPAGQLINAQLKRFMKLIGKVDRVVIDEYAELTKQERAVTLRDLSAFFGAVTHVEKLELAGFVASRRIGNAPLLAASNGDFLLRPAPETGTDSELVRVYWEWLNSSYLVDQHLEHVADKIFHMARRTKDSRMLRVGFEISAAMRILGKPNRKRMVNRGKLVITCFEKPALLDWAPVLFLDATMLKLEILARHGWMPGLRFERVGMELLGNVAMQVMVDKKISWTQVGVRNMAAYVLLFAVGLMGDVLLALDTKANAEHYASLSAWMHTKDGGRIYCTYPAASVGTNEFEKVPNVVVVGNWDLGTNVIQDTVDLLLGSHGTDYPKRGRDALDRFVYRTYQGVDLTEVTAAWVVARMLQTVGRARGLRRPAGAVKAYFFTTQPVEEMFQLLGYNCGKVMHWPAMLALTAAPKNAGTDVADRFLPPKMREAVMKLITVWQGWVMTEAWLRYMQPEYFADASKAKDFIKTARHVGLPKLQFFKDIPDPIAGVRKADGYFLTSAAAQLAIVPRKKTPEEVLERQKKCLLDILKEHDQLHLAALKKLAGKRRVFRAMGEPMAAVEAALHALRMVGLVALWPGDCVAYAGE